MDWLALLKFLGGAGIISAALIYIAKRVIDTFLDTRIESYKANLEKIAIEHGIRFQQLHTERAQVIKELYEKIVVLDFALGSALKPLQHESEPSLVEKVNALSKAFNDLYFFFPAKRIYFEKKLCSAIDNIIKISRGVFSDITVYPVNINSTECKYDPNVWKGRHEYWQKARSSYEKEILQSKEDLEDSFRELLGIKASLKN
jgi:nicotinamide mononucleotide adenylyltransferase